MTSVGPRAARALGVVVAGATLLVGASGCGIHIPSDPDGTLDRIHSSGELRVGASPAQGLIAVDDGDVSGPLADLVEDYGRSQNATVEWTIGSEEELVDELENGELDLAVGGMTDATAWIDRVSAMRGYSSIPGAGDRSIVLLLPLGENALQTSIETFLDEEVGP